jgi:hypothetical protein
MMGIKSIKDFFLSLDEINDIDLDDDLEEEAK